MQKNFRRQGPWEECWRVTERFSRSIDASENVLLSLRHSQENPAKNIPLYEAYLVPVSLHYRRPSSISASRISHLTEYCDWSRVKAYCNQLTGVWPVWHEKKSMRDHFSLRQKMFSWHRNYSIILIFFMLEKVIIWYHLLEKVVSIFAWPNT